MHVEVSVALNFVISYLYNKLPRRRVDMLGSELEKGLKKKFEGHWYPTMPFKGSGFRCVRVNGEQIDPVIINAATNVGISLEEMKTYLPDELTLWIDPNEVSYRIGEKGQIKVLYSDRNSEENNESEDREVQATNRGFNPDAQSFNPEPVSFKPIDGLSASLGSLSLSPSGGLSPSSPISSSSWCGSQSNSPSGGPMIPPLGNNSQSPVQAPAYGPKQNNTTLFTTAMFAQTKFGSTKLKTNAKRPTRLSPTEFGNIFKQKAMVSNTLQHPGITSPPRSRSLSPRDPRVEFLIDQQHRILQTQQHHQHQQHIQQQFQQQQQLHLQQQQMNFHLQQQQQQFQQKRLNIPTDHLRMGAANLQQNTGPLHEMFSGPSPLQSPGGQSPSSLGQSLVQNSQSPQQQQQQQLGTAGMTASQRSRSAGQSPLGSPMRLPMNSNQISPENQKALLDGLNMNNVPYSSSNQYHQLLLAS